MRRHGSRVTVIMTKIQIQIDKRYDSLKSNARTQIKYNKQPKHPQFRFMIALL